jgi:hypothetical protein
VSPSWLRLPTAGFATTQKPIDIYPENAVATRKKTPEDLQAIKKRLKAHLASEAKVLAAEEDTEMQAYVTSLGATPSRDEETQELVLKYSRDNYDIEIRINPEEVGEDEGEQGEAEQGEEEHEEKEENVEEDKEEEKEEEDYNTPAPHLFYVQLTSRSSGKKIMLQCTATSDFDTRVESLKVSTKEGKFDDDELPFPHISGELQDVLYDFLADVDVDERTAKYVLWRVEHDAATRAAASINRLKDFFE